MLPALEALTAVNLFDQSVQESATEMIKLAVADAIREIAKNEKVDALTRYTLIEKLGSAKLLVMFPDDILNLTKIEELYRELDFQESESLIELSMKMEIHNSKLRLQPQDGWIKNLHTFLDKTYIDFIVDKNVLRNFCFFLANSDNQVS